MQIRSILQPIFIALLICLQTVNALHLSKRNNPFQIGAVLAKIKLLQLTHQTYASSSKSPDLIKERLTLLHELYGKLAHHHEQLSKKIPPNPDIVICERELHAMRANLIAHYVSDITMIIALLGATGAIESGYLNARGKARQAYHNAVSVFHRSLSNSDVPFRPPICKTLASASVSECNGLTAISSKPEKHIGAAEEHKQSYLVPDMHEYLGADNLETLPTTEALAKMKADHEKYLAWLPTPLN